MYRHIFAAGGSTKSRFILRFSLALLSYGILSGCASVGPRDVFIGPAKELGTAVSKTLQVTVPAGEVKIIGTRDNELTGRLEIYCESDAGSCAERARETKFITTKKESTTIVSVEPERAFAYRKADAKYVIHVPTVESLLVNMGPGTLHVKDVQGCLSVDMDAGDVKVELPHSEIRRVSVKANFGDASLRLPDNSVEGDRKLLVGAKVQWDKGDGDCPLDIKLQAGDARVVLH